MTKKVYVVFNDHEDKYTDNYECQWDYGHEFRGIAGTKKEARGIMEELALLDYYFCFDSAEYSIIEHDIYGYPIEDDILCFDVLKDKYDLIELNVCDNINRYYFEEFEVTFEKEAG